MTMVLSPAYAPSPVPIGVGALAFSFVGTWLQGLETLPVSGLTYDSGNRGLEVIMTYYGILDRTPLGRHEGEPAYPTWMRRHDEFAAA